MLGGTFEGVCLLFTGSEGVCSGSKGVSLGNMGDVSSRSAMSECAGASLSLSEENSLILTILYV